MTVENNNGGVSVPATQGGGNNNWFDDNRVKAAEGRQKEAFIQQMLMQTQQSITSSWAQADQARMNDRVETTRSLSNNATKVATDFVSDAGTLLKDTKDKLSQATAA